MRARSQDRSADTARTFGMRTSRLCAAGAAAITVLASGAETPSGESATRLRGPFLLVTLPSLGTVTWTCDLPDRYPSFALGYRASPRHATTALELRSGGRVVARHTIQPGRRVRFRFLRTRRQTLALVQGTGAGTLRASVAVDFVPGTPVPYCEPYAPPALRVHVSPRQ